MRRSRAITNGWPIAAGQPVQNGGDVPVQAILNASGGNVRNDSGGYVLRSYT